MMQDVLFRATLSLDPCYNRTKKVRKKAFFKARDRRYKNMSHEEKRVWGIHTTDDNLFLQQLSSPLVGRLWAI